MMAGLETRERQTTPLRSVNQQLRQAVARIGTASLTE
jgi:hypothetical protein